MFNVLIVDDQKLIRDGVKSILDNSEISFDSIYLASNGEEAIKIMEQDFVSLVITDICMPDMNGLQVLEISKGRFPEASFLIISGYDDFKYAQKAIELGAKAYLLKPIEREPLLTAVVKIQEEVKLKRQMLNKDNLLSERDQMLKQYELKQYMEGAELQHKTILRLVDEFPVLQGQYQLIIIGSPNIRLNTSDINPVARIKAIAIQNCRDKLYVCIEYNNYILLIAEADKNADFIIQSINDSRIKTVSAICGLFNEINELPGAFSQIMELYNHRFLFPEKSILSPADMINLKENYTIPYNDIEHIMHIIGNCSSMEIEAYINRVFNRDTLVKYRIGYTLAICDNVYHNLKAIEKVIRPYIEDAVIDINKRHSLLKYESMREYLKILRFQIEKLNDLFFEFKISYRDNNDMNKAIAYINMNYQRPLTLAMVSNTVSLNYTYFSNVFKKYTGQSFLEYLRSIRVEKAKKLLLETDFKIGEISNKVGYDHYKNFARAFKEETGVTPIEYRRTIQMVQSYPGKPYKLTENEV